MRAAVVRRIVLMLCTACAAMGFAGAATPTESHPQHVRIGLQLRNLAGIDEVKERFEVAGTIVASWPDPSLAYRPHNAADRNREVAKSAWRPMLAFRNEVDQARFKNPDIYAEPDGTIIYTQDFNATLSTDLDLRKFPFDSESLPVVVEPAGEDAERVVLQFDPKFSSAPKARYAELAQWIWQSARRAQSFSLFKCSVTRGRTFGSSSFHSFCW